MGSVAEWCRSCGRTAGSGQACQSCHVSLDGAQSADEARSRVGLVHEQRRKLRSTRQAMCIADAGGMVTLHFSAKETATVPADDVEFSDQTSPASSPACRILQAVRNVRMTNDWDHRVLLERVQDLLRDSVGARRVLANEALDEHWQNVFDELDLSATEKAWLQAHEAAAYGHVEDLLRWAAMLPDDGYVQKIALVQPYLPELATMPDSRQLLDRWARAAVPGSAALQAHLSDDWETAMSGGAAVLEDSGEHLRAKEWRTATESIRSGTSREPLLADRHDWAAATTYMAACAGRNIDADLELIRDLPLPLLDDLVDAGSLTPAAALASLPSPAREHLGARLVPEQLDDALLAAVAHHTERARRRFLARDGLKLATLPDGPGVRHYRALLDIVLGGQPDPELLRPQAFALLEDAATSRAALNEGSATLPSTAVLADPTLWPLMAEDARDGRVQLSATDRERFPAFSQWCSMQRLVGLVFAGDWAAAERLGRDLVDVLQTERLQDEALNLTAFVVHQQGRQVEALALLEQALGGSYTEALLVNTSLLAEHVEPATAAKYFALLVHEAPTAELRRAAMLRAVGVWESMPAEATFPAELVDPLNVVLQGPCAVQDYMRLLRIAGYATPAIVMDLVTPVDERRGPLAIQRARIRFRDDPEFDQADFARAAIAVYRDQGRQPWFDSEWHRIVEGFRDATFVDFGDAMGSAIFWDTVNGQAPELLTLFQRLQLLPQSGAHMSAYFAREGSWLTDDAWAKFFFRPAEELLAANGVFEPAELEHLTDNMAHTMVVATLNHLDTRRNALASLYNEWVERQRWDTEKRFAIRQEMRNLLDTSAECVALLDRVVDRLRRLPLTPPQRDERISTISGPLNAWRAEIVDLRSDL
jgi:hypothetical protein